MEIALYSSGKRSKKFRSILFKGLWVSRGQSPPFTQETDIHSFSRLKSVPVLVVAVRRPKILSKKKKLPYRKCFKGRPLLQVSPSFSNSPPDCWRNSPPVERTASSASRKCVSFSGFRTWKVLAVVKKRTNRFPVQTKDSVLLKPASL